MAAYSVTLKAQVVTWFYFYLLIVLISVATAELVVNVKNQGGEVYQETINANTAEDTIQLDFQQTDGTIVRQFMDFRNEIQIVNVVLLGDEELQREQIAYQILCFVTRLPRTGVDGGAADFVPPDAMAKLRQKNPWAVRTPERDSGRENVTMDVLLDVRSSDWISPHIKDVCGDASSTYGRREELEAIVALNGTSSQDKMDKMDKVNLNEQFLRSVKPLYPVAPTEECARPASGIGGNGGGSGSKDVPCMCHLDQCIGWYPCALKYCHAPSTASHEARSYRCGIHTCKRCLRFYFSVPRRFTCVNT